MEKERQSNIELLRLLCMYVLPFLHFCVFCLPQSISLSNQTVIWSILPKILCSFMTLQVNLFVLISGWFGIHTTLRKLIQFYVICAFYSILVYCISLFLPGTTFTLKDAIISFMPFSFLPGWWFVKAYLFLLLLAPLFNKAIEYMSKQEYIWCLFALTLINVFYGFFCRQSINPNGCNFMQVMYMYFIGRYIALHVSFDKHKLHKKSAICAIIGVALYATVWILNDFYLHWVSSLAFFNNNNPWSMFNTIAIFLFFVTMEFKSRSINWLAKGVFPVYLVHTSIWISAYWNNYFIGLYDKHDPFSAWTIVLVLFTIYFIVIVCFDHIRAYFTSPIISAIDQQLHKLIKLSGIC